MGKFLGGRGGFSRAKLPGGRFSEAFSPGAFFLEPIPIKPFKANVVIILNQSNFLWIKIDWFLFVIDNQPTVAGFYMVATLTFKRLKLLDSTKYFP